jgi:DNA-binding response OmpR family regulator
MRQCANTPTCANTLSSQPQPQNMNTHILLVEDNERLGYILKEYLAMKGFEVTWADDGNKGWAAFEKQTFSLCVLDIMMPGMDGYRLAEKIKQSNPDMPLIFLTAKSQKIDVLKGFNIGADDFIKKPVDEEELVARINAVLKRAAPEKPAGEPSVISIGRYTFDPKNQELRIDDEVQMLTKREADVLHLLCRNIDQLTPRTQMLKSLWGKNDFFTRKSMDVFISRLRKYLSKDENVQIVNVHGSGFILKVKGG